MERIIAILLIDCLFTAFAYLLFPVSFCVRNKKLTITQIKKIVGFNGLIVWFFFAIVKINSGIVTNSAAVFLWSGIAYILLKKKCLLESQPLKSKESRPYVPRFKSEPIEIVTEEQKSNEKVRVTLASDQQKTYGNYNVYGRDLELVHSDTTKEKVESASVEVQQETVHSDRKISEGRKQLVNLAMNVSEDKVELALKLLRAVSEDEKNNVNNH